MCDRIPPKPPALPITGRFARDCCPAYLTPEGFRALKEGGALEALHIENGFFLPTLNARQYTKVSGWLTAVCCGVPACFTCQPGGWHSPAPHPAGSVFEQFCSPSPDGPPALAGLLPALAGPSLTGTSFYPEPTAGHPHGPPGLAG